MDKPILCACGSFFFSSHMRIKQYLIKCTMIHFTFIHPNQYGSAVSASCYKRLWQLTSEPKISLRLNTGDRTENSSVSYRVMCHHVVLHMSKLTQFGPQSCEMPPRPGKQTRSNAACTLIHIRWHRAGAAKSSAQGWSMFRAQGLKKK